MERDPANFFGGGVHSGEPRMEILSQGQVIKTNHSDIIGNPDPQFIECKEGPDRAFIAAPKYGIGF